MSSSHKVSQELGGIPAERIDGTRLVAFVSHLLPEPAERHHAGVEVLRYQIGGLVQSFTLGFCASTYASMNAITSNSALKYPR